LKRGNLQATRVVNDQHRRCKDSNRQLLTFNDLEAERAAAPRVVTKEAEINSLPGSVFVLPAS
jgi:hypothetical protein